MRTQTDGRVANGKQDFSTCHFSDRLGGGDDDVTQAVEEHGKGICGRTTGQLIISGASQTVPG